MGEPTTVRLSEVATQARRRVVVEPGVTYPLLGVRWYGKGSFLREEVTAETAKARHYFRVCAGDFVYNRLFAWKASFAVIPPDQDGCYVSGEFPLFVLDRSQAMPEYLLLLMLRAETIDRVNAESTGSTSVSRNRWREEFFLDLEVELPPLEEQERRVRAVALFDSYIDNLRSELDAAELGRRAVAEALTGPNTGNT
jgi:type I restriction enzyme S subunit